MHVSIATSHHENVIFRVLTLMLLLGVRCVWVSVLVCNVWVLVCNLFPCGWLFEAFDLPQRFHVFLLLVDVSSTFRDFKPYLFHISSRASSLKKCLKQLREAKNMKPLWKVKGFEKQKYQPQHTGKDTRTDRRKVIVMHKTSRRTGTGTGTARRGTAQDSTGEQNRQGDTETTLTFRALHGNHIVSIPFETILKKKRPDRFRPQMSSPDIHPPPPHDMQFACLSSSFFISVIPMFYFFLYLPDTIEQFKT